MQTSSIIDKLVTKLERRAPISAKEREALTSALERVDDYPIGAEFVKQGSSPTSSCLIVEGFAGRVTFLPGGGRQLLAFHIAGDFCDLHSYVLQKMDHAIQALSICKVAKFPHARLADLSAKYPELTRALWWDTAVDAAVHREWMIGLGRRSAYERIAHLYCEMYLRLKAIGRTSGDSYELAITQEDLGDAVGLTAVHVNRMLKQLREPGLVTVHRNRVTIPNLQALKVTARFDRTYLIGRVMDEDL